MTAVKTIYMDYAAATPLDLAVLEAMKPFFAENFYNPSALYQGARASKAALEEARQSVSQSIGAKPSEVIFTAGGTESANLAIRGIMQAHQDGELIVSAVEHDAVLQPANEHQAKIATVDTNGVVDIKHLTSLLSDKTVLISVMYANNEVGSVQPIEEIVKLVKGWRADRKRRGVDMPLYVHTDAAQAPLYLDCSVARIGVDLMTLNGGKMYGPKQSGILYRRAGVVMKPILTGGGQEYGMRSGTENVAACVGFAKALELAANGRHERVQSMQELSSLFRQELTDRFGAELHGHPKKRLPNNIHVSFKDADNERMLFSLDEQGVWAAVGSACSASNDEPSHVLKAMGLSDEAARSSLRFTLGKETTRADIVAACQAIANALVA